MQRRPRLSKPPAQSQQEQTRAQKIYALEQMETSADLSVLQSTKKTERIVYKSYVFWIVVLVGLGLFFVMKYLYIKSKYKYIISQIDKAKQQGSAFPISGFFVALVLEYPFLSAIKIGNPSLPLAISYAYTSDAIAPTMGTGYDASVSPPIDYLAMMWEVSKDCGYRMSDTGDCSALFIVCRIFRNCDRADCFPPCPTGGVSVGNAGYQWTAGLAGSGSTWAMAGAMLGPVGAIVGGLAGAIFGGITTAAKRARRKKQCAAIQKNCYLPPGASFDCPVPNV